MIVWTTSGETRTATALHPCGSEQKPLSDTEIEAKTWDNTGLGGSGVDAGRVIEAVWRLDQAASLQPLIQVVVVE